MPEIEKQSPPPPPQCENDRGTWNSQSCLVSECASNVHGENGRIALAATSSAASLMKKKPTCARAEEGGKEERRVDKEDLKRKREGEEKKKKPALGVLRRKIKPTNGELLARARVPEASLTHYVIAPRWNVSSSSSATSPAATSSSVDNEMRRKRARDDASGNVPVRQFSSSSSSSSNRSNIEKRVKSIARAAAIARRRPRNPNGHLSITGKHIMLIVSFSSIPVRQIGASVVRAKSFCSISSQLVYSVCPKAQVDVSACARVMIALLLVCCRAVVVCAVSSSIIVTGALLDLALHLNAAILKCFFTNASVQNVMHLPFHYVVFLIGLHIQRNDDDDDDDGDDDADVITGEKRPAIADGNRSVGSSSSKRAKHAASVVNVASVPTANLDADDPWEEDHKEEEQKTNRDDGRHRCDI
ncbi:hypothetical protein Aperf_G00000082611 [Anoplocephala perfoliata]